VIDVLTAHKKSAMRPRACERKLATEWRTSNGQRFLEWTKEKSGYTDYPFQKQGINCTQYAKARDAVEVLKTSMVQGRLMIIAGSFDGVEGGFHANSW